MDRHLEPSSTFYSRLKDAWATSDSSVCVGLDPDPAYLPRRFLESPDGIFKFNRLIIEATADLVCCFKPQIAFYASQGAELALKSTIQFIKEQYPNRLVILDSKRGDIGNTAEHYASEAFDRFGADAVTVNPYMGGDSLRPFLKRQDRGVVILCRTSNPGSGDFQSLDIDGEPLYLRVAKKAGLEWNAHRNVLLVMGATYPEELGRVRAAVGEVPFLVPGIGVQGGDLKATLEKGRTLDGQGLIINSSRGIIFAGIDLNQADRAPDRVTDVQIQEGARQAALTLNAEISRLRLH